MYFCPIIWWPELNGNDTPASTLPTVGFQNDRCHFRHLIGTRAIRSIPADLSSTETNVAFPAKLTNKNYTKILALKDDASSLMLYL